MRCNPVEVTSCGAAGSIAKLLCLLLLTCSLESRTRAQDTPSATAPIRWPGLREAQWSSDSFWGQHQFVCRTQTLPSMTALMEGNTQSHFIENFRIAAGLTQGKHRGPAWNDGDTYKWLEALCAAYATQPDPATLKTIESAIQVIAAAQREDGYLHTPALIAARNDPSLANILSDPGQFEMYNFGHLMTAACTHLEATGDRQLLDVALRAAAYLDNYFAKPNSDQARHAICPAHYMGLVDLYRTTGDQRWLRLATRLLNMRDLVEGGGDDNQDRIPFREQRQAVGHAVRANYLYAGAADLMRENRDATLWMALDACWQSVHEKKIYITGGCGALYDGASPDGSKQQSSITRIHQAYGRDYQLPNSTAHNETCAAIGNVLWNARMWQISHDAKYIEALENSLMNAVLAGISADGQRFFYTNTLRQLETMPTELRWSRERQAWISCYCCPPNVARTLATMHRFAYAVDEQSVWVLLYGSNRLQTKLSDGSSLCLEQKSNYPWDGRVELTVLEAPQRPITLRLRIPKWCSHASLTRNQQPSTEQLAAGSFVDLPGTLKAGDHIVLNLDMPTRLMRAHPLVEECRGQVAVQRGPLVYCLESVDLPEDVRLLDVSLKPKDVSQWEIKRQQLPIANANDDANKVSKPSTASFNGIAASLVLHSTREQSFNPKLYSEYQPTKAQELTAQMIPYFLWGNRGNSEMSVWLPIDEP